MSKSKPVLTSSLGKKLIMSLTGLFLCTFLVVHLIGNLQLFKDDGGIFLLRNGDYGFLYAGNGSDCGRT